MHITGPAAGDTEDGGKVRVLSIPAIGIGWCKGRSSSYWSRSSRPTSNRARLDIVQGQLMKRSTGWQGNCSAQDTRHRHRLRSYFDNVRHDRLLAKGARRVE